MLHWLPCRIRDCIQILGEEGYLKSKQHSPTASPSGSSTKTHTTLLEKPSSAAARQLKCSHSHRKNLELVEEAKKDHLNIVKSCSQVHVVQT